MIEFLPDLFFYIFAIAALFMFLTWFLTISRPATAEARIGYYAVHMVGPGKKFYGITTLAKELVSTRHFQRLKSITDVKLISDKFRNLFFYALRHKMKKILIISPRSFESAEYSDVEKNTFKFPFGWVSKRHVYVKGLDIGKIGGWRVLVCIPLNVARFALAADEYDSFKSIGSTAASIRRAAVRIDKDIPFKEKFEATANQLRDSQKENAKLTHRVFIAEKALAQKQLGAAETAPVKSPSGLGFSLDWTATLLAIGLGVFGYLVLPSFMAIDAWIPALVLAVIGYIIGWRML